MIVTLIAWIYITCICYCWGKSVLQFTEKISHVHNGKNNIPFSIVCFTGLAAIGCVAGTASLFMPLGLWQLQIPLLLPCIPVLRKTFSEHSLRINPFRSLHIAIGFLLGCIIILILVMSTWTVTHPDSIDYHLQIIQWIEKYKPIPGLSHINLRLGLQNLWFPLCALFSFSFIHIGSPIFLNAVVVIWFLYFVLIQINRCMSEQDHTNALLWTALLVFSAWSYTQVRLTVTSASPDFIAAIYIWLVFYLMQSAVLVQNAVKFVLLVILGSFILCIKLSALPLVLVVVYAIWKLVTYKNIRALFFSGAIGCLLLCSLVTRNIITTGYPLFPSTFPNLMGIDWKLKKTEVTDVQKYITDYARTGSDGSKEAVQKTLAMKPLGWLPIWWFNRSLADKIIILLLTGSILIVAANLKKIAYSGEEMKISVLISLAGIIFWFIQAPDPRFGFGFVMPFIGLTCILLLNKNTAIHHTSFVRKMVMPCLIAGGVLLTFYTCYRFTKYFSARQLLQPMGIVNIPYHKVQLSGILFNIPDNGPGCGDVSVPCCDKDVTKDFILRGQTISDGFKSPDE